MINIFFVPGMFGSTIEYVLRNFTQEHRHMRIDSDFICKDGSMHFYKKQFHHNTVKSIQASLMLLEQDSISTPTYPFKNQHLPEILEWYKQFLDKSDNILIYADCLRSAELNLLFQYYKIAFGSKLKLGLDVFCGDNSHNIVKWNPKYKHWSEMQRWELREWFSLFYPTYVQEWIESSNQVPKNFLKITNTDLLYDSHNSLNSIIQHCKLSKIDGMSTFLDHWRIRQQYIVDLFILLDKIVNYTLDQQEFDWSTLDVISEAIVQQRLRSQKFEIRCDSLNIFPTNSKILYNLLERC